jgi:hypothetical protein
MGGGGKSLSWIVQYLAQTNYGNQKDRRSKSGEKWAAAAAGKETKSGLFCS